MEQQIRFCTTSDGVRIAYATVGQGPPLVVPPCWWISDLECSRDDPDIHAFYEALAQRYTLVLYDRRGTGLSERKRRQFTLEADADDMQTVVDRLSLKRFPVLGICHGGPIATAYTARHTRQVSRLVLFGTFAHGPNIARDDIKASMLAMIRGHWGVGSRMIADLAFPGGEGDVLERMARQQREGATGQTAANLLQMAYTADLSALLPEVKVPTLVLHHHGDRVFSFRLAIAMASQLPNARLVGLEGNTHFPWHGDFSAVLGAVFDFLEEGRPAREVAASAAPSGLVTILFTDMEGSTTLTQRLGDSKAQEVLHTHNGIIRDALKAHGGAEIKHTGDGLMASFASASRALECAVAIQQGLAAHNARLSAHPEPVEGRAERQPSAHPSRASGRADRGAGSTPAAERVSIRVRIGLNAGEPVAEERDLFGTAVQLAARVCAQAEPGQILAANVVRELAAGKGFLFSDQGDVALRGFEDPVRLYEVQY